MIAPNDRNSFDDCDIYDNLLNLDETYQAEKESTPAIPVQADEILQISKVLQTYNTFIQPYENVVALVNVWLDNLSREFEEKFRHNPIHNIRSRIKTLPSISDKLNRRGIEASFENARDYLTDIAGMRVTCYYIQDVYTVIDALKTQSGTIIIRESDYIKNPKSNGYRTYHLIMGIALSNAGEYYPVEIQIRTLAMDFWASMEHQLVYKNPDKTAKSRMSEELKGYADYLNTMELKLAALYDDNAVLGKRAE